MLSSISEPWKKKNQFLQHQNSKKLFQEPIQYRHAFSQPAPRNMDSVSTNQLPPNYTNTQEDQTTHRDLAQLLQLREKYGLSSNIRSSCAFKKPNVDQTLWEPSVPASTESLHSHHTNLKANPFIGYQNLSAANTYLRRKRGFRSLDYRRLLRQTKFHICKWIDYFEYSKANEADKEDRRCFSQQSTNKTYFKQHLTTSPAKQSHSKRMSSVASNDQYDLTPSPTLKQHVLAYEKPISRVSESGGFTVPTKYNTPLSTQQQKPAAKAAETKIAYTETKKSQALTDKPPSPPKQKKRLTMSSSSSAEVEASSSSIPWWLVNKNKPIQVPVENEGVFAETEEESGQGSLSNVALKTSELNDKKNQLRITSELPLTETRPVQPTMSIFNFSDKKDQSVLEKKQKVSASSQNQGELSEHFLKEKGGIFFSNLENPSQLSGQQHTLFRNEQDTHSLTEAKFQSNEQETKKSTLDATENKTSLFGNTHLVNPQSPITPNFSVNKTMNLFTPLQQSLVEKTDEQQNKASLLLNEKNKTMSLPEKNNTMILFGSEQQHTSTPQHLTESKPLNQKAKNELMLEKPSETEEKRTENDQKKNTGAVTTLPFFSPTMNSNKKLLPSPPSLPSLFQTAPKSNPLLNQETHNKTNVMTTQKNQMESPIIHPPPPASLFNNTTQQQQPTLFSPTQGTNSGATTTQSMFGNKKQPENNPIPSLFFSTPKTITTGSNLFSSTSEASRTSTQGGGAKRGLFDIPTTTTPSPLFSTPQHQTGVSLFGTQPTTNESFLSSSSSSSQQPVFNHNTTTSTFEPENVSLFGNAPERDTPTPIQTSIQNTTNPILSIQDNTKPPSLFGTTTFQQPPFQQQFGTPQNLFNSTEQQASSTFFGTPTQQQQPNITTPSNTFLFNAKPQQQQQQQSLLEVQNSINNSSQQSTAAATLLANSQSQESRNPFAANTSGFSSGSHSRRPFLRLKRTM